MRIAEEEDVIITQDDKPADKPAGVLVGFKSEEDWLDYQLENDPRFLAESKRRDGRLAEDSEPAWRTSKSK